jgi:glycolate oxidase
VAAVVRACAAQRVAVVTQGGNTGLVGASVPDASGTQLLLSLTRMNRVRAIDAANLTMSVDAGCILQQVQEAAAAQGLLFPLSLAAEGSCTIGGNLATNAGGLCCVKYGVTTDSVLGLEVVLADGEILKTGRRTVKGVAGYDLARLFVGSEGTLGVITQATVQLKPLPQAPATFVAGFTTTEAAGEAVARVVREGLVPSLLEIMDASSIKASETYLKTDLGAGSDCQALLLGQSDAGGEVARRELAALEQICVDCGADLAYTTEDLEEGRMLLQARRVVLTALETYGLWLTDDVCVPRTRIAELIRGCEKVSEDVGLRIAVVGHAGDGNMHPTIVYQPDDPDEFARARRAFDEILEIGLSLGGTVTGEHGVGKIKREWLEREIGPIGMRVHRQIKQALDPENLFNPGSMFSMT